MGYEDSKLTKFLKHEIDSINMHLPKKRVSLEMALKGFNLYVSKENNQIHIDMKEVQLLKELCPIEKLKSVYLPILIIRRRDLGTGTYVISGELIEQYLVLKAISKIDEDWDKFTQKELKSSSLFLYKPNLIELRKVLPTSTVIGFS
ncbi:MAG: DUF61 family protein [Candidatus Heimdallarchaeota archaeon]|nr:DUF61 family protein [Candidatus Heimdallarchaeota archaeon]